MMRSIRINIGVSVVVATTIILILSALCLCKGFEYIKVADPTSAPDIYWINMESSHTRREATKRQMDALGYIHTRVKAISPDNLYIPQDVSSNWNLITAAVSSIEKIPTRTGNYTHVLLGLVGREKRNKLKEVYCTSSHLEAIRQAVHGNLTTSKYALITEDDIYFPFNLDLAALAAAAPKDFGIIQLFNSNEESMDGSMKRYLSSNTLWLDSFQKQPAAFWSTCAYLINREILGPIIDKIIYKEDDWMKLRVIAALKKPCRPNHEMCCTFHPETGETEFYHEAPCIWSIRGFQADVYIYALAKTYVLSVPLITNARTSNRSTFHQSHVVDIHQFAFAKQRAYINRIIGGEIKLPPFATIAQTMPLDLQVGAATKSQLVFPQVNRHHGKHGKHEHNIRGVHSKERKKHRKPEAGKRYEP